MHSSCKCQIQQYKAVTQFGAVKQAYRSMHCPLFFALVCIGLVSATWFPSVKLSSQVELSSQVKFSIHRKPGPKTDVSCFPALGFEMPSEVPPDSKFSSWWCDPVNEYAFVGFSYEVTACQYSVFSLFFLTLIDFTRSEQVTAHLWVQRYPQSF